MAVVEPSQSKLRVFEGVALKHVFRYLFLLINFEQDKLRHLVFLKIGLALFIEAIIFIQFYWYLKIDNLI